MTYLTYPSVADPGLLRFGPQPQGWCEGGDNLSLPAATKLGQGNVFTGVCDSVHGGGCLLWGVWSWGGIPACTEADTHPPLGSDTPPWSRHSPGEQTPPWEQTLPRGADTPLGADPPPPREADARIRSMSGRYASYWNAFLFGNNFSKTARQWKKLGRGEGAGRQCELPTVY